MWGVGREEGAGGGGQHHRQLICACIRLRTRRALINGPHADQEDRTLSLLPPCSYISLPATSFGFSCRVYAGVYTTRRPMLMPSLSAKWQRRGETQQAGRTSTPNN